MTKSTIAQAVKKRYTTLNGNQQEIFDEVERYKQMYRSFMDESDSYPWDYQYFDPQIFPLMRAHLARLNPHEAKITLESRNGQDLDAKVANQQVVNWELGEILLTQIFYRLMYSGFMAGRGYMKSGWKYKPARVIQDGDRQIQMSEIVNRADLTSVRFNDLFIPNRNIPDLMLQPYLVERISMRFGDLLDDQKITQRWNQKYLEEIQKKNIFSTKIAYGVDLPQEDDLKENTLIRSQYVNLLCMHTIDGEVFWTFEDASAPDWVLNNSSENEYFHGHYPYIDFAPFPEDDEFFSLGIVQPIADLQEAINSSLNQLLTNARKAGNPMWITGEDGAQTPDWVFVNRPNGVVRVSGDPTHTRPIEQRDNTLSLLKARQELQTSFERTSGISSLYMSGAASSPQVNKTATGAQIINNNIDQNLELLISLFGAQVLKTTGEHFLELNAQYITEEQTVKITGKRGASEYVNVSPDEISANFDVKASPERMLKQSPATRQAGLINLHTTLSNAKREGAPINLDPVTEALVDSFPETENIDDIIIDPEKRANQVIESIMKGYEPPKAKYDDDHKAMIALIQKHLLDMPQEHSDEQLLMFDEYIEELKRFIQAKNPNLLSSGGQNDMVPMTQQGIEQSMAQQAGMGNPTVNQQIPLTEEQLAGM